MMCNSCPTGVVEHVMAAATTRQRHVCQSIVSSHKPVSGDHGGRRPRGIITLLDALILPFFQHFQLQHLLRLCSHRRTVSVSRLQHSCRRRRHRPTAVSQLWLFGGRKEERIQVRRPPALPFAPSLLRSLILVVFSSPCVAVECGVSYLPTSPRRAVLLEQGGKEDPVPVNVWLELARKRSLLPSVRPRFLCAMGLPCKYAASYDLDSGPTRDSCNISFDQGIESVDVTRFWVAIILGKTTARRLIKADKNDLK